MKALIIPHGFIGDILFSTPIAKLLKEHSGYTQVDYYIPLVQPRFLLDSDPYIDNVYVDGDPVTPNGQYHNVIELGPIKQHEPATIQLQKQAGLNTFALEYKINTVQILDKKAENFVGELRKKLPNYPVVAYQNNWEEKSVGFTKAEYWHNVDVPNKGYGGRLRNITHILSLIQESVILVSVGFPVGVPQQSSLAADPYRFASDASVIKYCDYMIGGEGGLTNLSAGIGTKTIITSDYIAQLYGPRGTVFPCEEPKMGPTTYFPNGSHSLLNPYLSDEEVAKKIVKIIHTKEPEVFDWKDM
jgi:ADP-heptose:LPS heptosyltransferase